jgi:Asp-tRNA(Asn)/Glu-tRNA(Gln) amidotransferase A subunit family amidase
MWDRADAEARSGLEDLAKELGAREVDLPDSFRAAWDAQRAIMAVDMAFNLGDLVDKGGDKISKALQDFVAEGRKVTAVAYQAALRDARRYADALAEIFEQLSDAILTLSARGVAPVGTATGDPAFCTFWTLTGLPALNLPILEGEGGLPIGVQLIGAHGRDEKLLRTARVMLEQLG